MLLLCMMLIVTGGFLLEKNCYGSDGDFSLLRKCSSIIWPVLSIVPEEDRWQHLFFQVEDLGYHYTIICLAGIRISTLELGETIDVI